jgi:hypothetical protein
MKRFACLLALGLGGCLGGMGGTTGSQQAVSPCPPTPAPTVFQNALCLCQDFDSVGASIAAHGANGQAASVGVNGRSNVVGLDSVDGSWAAYGGMSGTGRVHVNGDLVTTADLDGVGEVDVGGDLSVGGSISSVGALSVGGTLRVAGNDATLGLDQVHATGPYAAPAGPPCACDGATFLDVAAKVAAAKTQNDNAAHGLATSLATVGLSAITLSTGSYYFDHVETIGAIKITIDGVVALYLDGSLDTVGAEQFDVKPNATLDLYVSGAVRTVGALGLGSDPASVRLYVGGANAAVLSVGLQELSAMIYAPTAQIAFVGATLIHGAVFGRDLDGVGLLTLDYTAPAAPNPNQCTPPGSGSTGGGASGGGANGGPAGAGTPGGGMGTPGAPPLM